MNLYIKIENNSPASHPVIEQNLIDVFGKIPEGWAPFYRTLPPEINIKHHEYILMEDGITWTDKYT